jgi:hypothetical protein
MVTVCISTFTFKFEVYWSVFTQFNIRVNNVYFQGGSWISTGDEASRFARYAFRRHFLQHAGFRLARTVHKADKIELPTRVVDTEVYILGSGVEGIDLLLNSA